MKNLIYGKILLCYELENSQKPYKNQTLEGSSLKITKKQNQMM